MNVLSLNCMEPAKPFAPVILKRFEHWDLCLHENQYPYPGRAYAWAKRANAVEPTDANEEELKELYSAVIPQYRAAVLRSFGDARINIAALGNTTEHLHYHLIPRYRAGEISVGGEHCVDPNPKGNYSPYPRIPQDRSEALRAAVLSQMEGFNPQNA